ETNYDGVTADDWLITPPIYLKANCIYTYSFYVAPGSNYPERYEAGYGASTDPSAFTITTKPTEIAAGESGKRVSVDVQITQSGKYYFGVHALSTSDGYFMLVDNVSVTLKNNLSAPEAVKNLTVTPNTQGALSALIEFTAPSKSQGGTALSELEKVELYRGEALIHTFSHPAVGSKLSYQDNSPANGENVYKVVATNAAGEGLAAVKTVYVGEDIPLAPTNLVLKDKLNGKAMLTWESPGSVGEKGNFVNEANLKYNVYGVDEKGNPVLQHEGLTTMKCEVEIPTTGKQDLVYFAVTAQNATAESYPAVSNVVLGGTAYKLPFKESFPNGKLQSGVWTVDRDGNNYFDPVKSIAADGDGGSASFLPAKAGDAATLGSGKIALNGAENPWLVFRYYANPGKEAQLKLELARNGDTENLVDLQTINYEELTGKAGWRTVSVNLAPYKADSYVRLLFTAMSQDVKTAVVIDDINVRDALQHDLTATMTAPEKIEMGSSANV
ncbi:MAG: choice-of-anchor J domain-containing protein, partial [Rothia sp. (in: high G+C Gram-positive bacteria)]|uniref:choice-of-anchor J domain-containing protein n=1 Tax=Rothia sp. (in: high G+C Gram-positive bacteria) TaxID=1885016 RepID=UPI0026E08B3F